jgi:hypothetical protein
MSSQELYLLKLKSVFCHQSRKMFKRAVVGLLRVTGKTATGQLTAS